MSLGFTGLGAEIMSIEDDGGEKRMDILSRGVTKRAAVRGARIEASAITPFRLQDVEEVVMDRELGGPSTRYLITIAHNPDKGY